MMIYPASDKARQEIRMLSEIWTAAAKLEGGQTIIVTGFIGFLTLAIGHSVNAMLIRRRDRVLEKEQSARIATAFTTEISGLRLILGDIDLPNPGLGVISSKAVIPLASMHTPLRVELIKHISLLSRRQIKAAIACYNEADRFDARIQSMSGKLIGGFIHLSSMNSGDYLEAKAAIRRLNTELEMLLAEFGGTLVRENS